MPTQSSDLINPDIIDFMGKAGLDSARSMYHDYLLSRDANPAANIDDEDEDLDAEQGLDVEEEEKPPVDQHLLNSRRAQLPIMLSHYQQKLSETNKAMFHFLKPEQKKALKNQLTYTWYLLKNQLELDAMDGRRHTRSALEGDMRQCEDLLDRLSISSPKETPGSLLLADTMPSAKPLKFTSMNDFAPSIASRVRDFFMNELQSVTDHVTGSTITGMSKLNETRLYWVWGNSMDSNLLQSLQALRPGLNLGQAQRSLAAPLNVTGYTSWVLYYARLGLNLMMLFKGALPDRFLSEAERQVPWWQRFKTQWDQRWLVILNDAFWGPANMLCFLWLTGSAGDMLTVLLLTMDFALTCLSYFRESTAHNKRMLEIEEARQSLWQELQRDDLHEDQIIALKQQYDDLTTLHTKTHRDWLYRREGMESDMYYSGMMIMSFGLMCCFFFPPAMLPAVLAQTLPLLGGTLCFLLTLTNSLIRGDTDISNIRELGRDVENEGQALLDKYHRCTDDSDPDGNERRCLYLQLQAALAKSEHHADMARFKAINVVRGALIDALMPGIVLAAVIFLPLGPAWGVIAAVIALFMLSRFVMYVLEPKMGELPEFDEAAFLHFNANPPTTFPEQTGERPGFFQANQNGLHNDDPATPGEEQPLLQGNHGSDDDTEAQGLGL